MNKMILGLSAVALMSAGGVAIAQDGQQRGGKDRWAEMDSNNDDRLSQAEMLAHADARFARADKNNDGRLDSADRELRQAERHANRWGRLDANSDGNVTRAEYDAAHAARKAQREERRAQRAERRGERAQGGERRMRRAGAMRRGQRGMQMLRMADTNNDQAVSREEMRAMATARFARLDADNNGMVTKAEMQAQRAERRAKRSERRQQRRGN